MSSEGGHATPTAPPTTLTAPKGFDAIGGISAIGGLGGGGKAQATGRRLPAVRPARPFALLALLALAAAAGCLDGGGGGGDGSGPGPADAPYALDCSIASPEWAEPCLAWASPNESPSKTEIDLAVNPRDPMNVFVASKDMDPAASPGPCVWAIGQWSKDGGRTWETVYVGGTLDQRDPTEPLYGWRCITDPILQYTPDGVLHYSLQAYDYEPAGVAPPPVGVGGFELEGGNMYTALSTDGGETFPDVKLMHAGDELAVFHDFMRMGHSPATGTVFTVWNQITAVATRFPVLVATQADGTVRPPVYAPVLEAPGMAGINAIVGTPDGRVHWFMTVASNGQETLYRAVSDDDGRTFSVPEPEFTLTTMEHPGNVDWRMGTNVEVVADASGCLHAVWADGRSDAGDILHSRLCGGAAWSEPALVSSGPHEGAQVFPRASVDGRGTVHVVYLTQAYDPEHALVDADWSHSTDGGATWTTQRITAVSSDGNLGVHQNGGSFYGDYIGIGSAGDHTYMAFPVTVTGRAEIAVAHVVRA